MITANLTGNFGNWTAQYFITRILADMKGYEFGFDPPTAQYTNNGLDQFYFLDIDMGIPVQGIEHTFEEHWDHYKGINITTADNRVYNIQDNTRLIGHKGAYGGLFQSETYHADYKEKMLQWFKVKEDYCNTYELILQDRDIILDDNLCIINFRGGEYRGIPEVLLRKQYWADAVQHMRNLNPNMQFLCITDDIELATDYIPQGIPVMHIDIGFDYYVVNNARYLIISNSSFGLWAAWLNQKVKMTIAPRYWAHHNISDGYWALGDQWYKDFTYLDRDGLLYNYDTVKRAAIEYYRSHNILPQLYA